MREMTGSYLSPNEKVTLNIGNKGGAQGTTARTTNSEGSAFAPGFYLPMEYTGDGRTSALLEVESREKKRLEYLMYKML